MFLGHFAVPLIARYYFPEKVAMPALLAGSIAPDVMDKSLQQAGFAISSRSFAHTLLGLAASCLLMWAGFGRAAMVNWAAGYFVHLLCDTGGNVPWLYPFTAYHFRRSDRTLLEKLRSARPGPAELLLLGWATVLVARQLRQRPCVAAQ